MSANEALFSFPHYKFIHLIIHFLGSYVIYVCVCILFSLYSTVQLIFLPKFNFEF